MNKTQFFENGWCKFPLDETLVSWIEAVRSEAFKSYTRPENTSWHRCGGTWFAGVNVLYNDADGRLPGGPPMQGMAVDFIEKYLDLPKIHWDLAQVSILSQGYPKPMAEETDAAFQYRLKRDAAHVDGLRRIGPDRRRFAQEYHQFILGIPMTSVTELTSPLVVWEGSHEKVRTALQIAFKGRPADAWKDIDVTDIYHQVRREIFETCRRRKITAEPGEAYLLHRLALHGMAPWADCNPETPARAVIYFRPDGRNPTAWLEAT